MSVVQQVLVLETGENCFADALTGGSGDTSGDLEASPSRDAGDDSCHGAEPSCWPAAAATPAAARLAAVKVAGPLRIQLLADGLGQGRVARQAWFAADDLPCFAAGGVDDVGIVQDA